MSWLYLAFDVFFRIDWTFSLKLYPTMTSKYFEITLIIVSMLLSGLFIWVAQKDILKRTTYKIWTGVGVVGMLLAGVALLGHSIDVHMFSTLLIVVGMIGLKLTD